MNYQQARLAAVKFLAGEQAPDGSFMGWAGTSIEDFKVERPQPTIFFTALVLQCLRQVPGTATIRKRAAKFLLQQKSEAGSWNYWRRDSTVFKHQPYPDDMDDTACVLAALASYDKQLIDGAVLAQLAKLLVAVEDKPGGPYGTWLIDKKELPKWHDIDLAVNANIGYFLAGQGVQLPGLEDYTAKALASRKLASSYYVGDLPLVYFLARWYYADGHQALVRIINKKLLQASHQSALGQALLLTGACNLGFAKSKLKTLHERLLASCKQGTWPAAALYVDPQYGGKQHYGGSIALTTAFALEALECYARIPGDVPTTPNAKNRSSLVFKKALADSAAIPDQKLKRNYQSLVRNMQSRDKDRQVSGMANLMAEACHKPITENTILQLNLGSLNGWIAYTIYDDFLDNQGVTDLLGVANYAHRRSLKAFLDALPGDADFGVQVLQAFDTVDAANSWELQHARAVVRGDTVAIDQLPDYAAYGQLAERSWGHSLAAVGILLALGYERNSSEVLQLQTFFRHFLIARQLNDDAHDWQADLKAGQLNAVVVLLLKDHKLPYVFDPAADMEMLNLRFWETTIPDVAELIQHHVAAARTALATCKALRNTEAFESWLRVLESAAKQALDGRHEAQQFIKTYQKN